MTDLVLMTLPRSSKIRKQNLIQKTSSVRIEVQAANMNYKKKSCRVVRSMCCKNFHCEQDTLIIIKKNCLEQFCL